MILIIFCIDLGLIDYAWVAQEVERVACLG